MNTLTATCPKCNGAGKINAFSHVANGTCFDCKGSGKIRCTQDAIRSRLMPHVVRKCEWLMGSTAEDYERLPLERIENARKWVFAGPVNGYPDLASHWNAVAEPVFLRKRAH